MYMKKYLRLPYLSYISDRLDLLFVLCSRDPLVKHVAYCFHCLVFTSKQKFELSEKAQKKKLTKMVRVIKEVKKTLLV